MQKPTLKIHKIGLMFAAAAALAAGVFIFALSDAVKSGAEEGLRICAGTVIPSLFPFAVLAYFMSAGGIFEPFLKFAEGLTQKLLGLNGDEFFCFLMSMLGGYPVGAGLIDKMCADKRLSPKRARVLLLFSVNAGPPFVVTAVGTGMIHSKKAGTVLLAAHILSSLIMCRVLTLFYPPTTEKRAEKKPALSLGDCFVDAVRAASKGMFSICGWVVFFSAFRPIFKALPLGGFSRFALPLFEVTSGLSEGNFTVPETAFFLGFSGFSVIFQVMASSKNFTPKLLFTVISRFAHGLISFALCKLYLSFFPLYVETVSNGKIPVYFSNSVTIPAAAALVLTLCVFYGFIKADSRHSPPSN